ncbi:HFX_2341 family transcriptional regulator domain-containing protein [Halogeometricum limi]|uniref:Uncharacterized protein n=1 Tax=Halogeometricum limi TaxID=555875 RepID=A0A1I6IG34_9EURY|nr:DUF6293 family protein [Halogeometricum limi]SFR65609.1 hypothetical protein SAMN04488124_3213 [Halogeometricum limi]
MKNIVEVHIIPIWDGFDEALAPVEKHRPDVVYLLEDENAEMPARYDGLRRDIAANVRELHVGRLDLFDLYDVMGFVTTLADGHRGDTVRVNISAGTADSALGATMACMDDRTEADPFRVLPADPTPGEETGETRLVEGDGLNVFPIDSPTRDQLIALAVIEACNTDGRQTKLKTILEHGRTHGMDCLQGVEGKGRYNKLRAYATDFLEEKGYVEITEVSSQTKHVAVTETGLQTLRAFRHRIEDVIRALENSDDERIHLDLDHPAETLERWTPDGGARRRASQ